MPMQVTTISKDIPTDLAVYIRLMGLNGVGHVGRCNDLAPLKIRKTVNRDSGVEDTNKKGKTGTLHYKKTIRCTLPTGHDGPHCIIGWKTGHVYAAWHDRNLKGVKQ